MDILLINPAQAEKNYVAEHLGIASLKAFVNSKGYSADTIDMAIEGISITECLHKIINSQPEVVGISLLDASKTRALSLIRQLRNNGFIGKIIVGGYFATFSSFELLRDFSEIDYVVRGEGELTLIELLEYLFDNSQCTLSNIQGLSYREKNDIIENPSRPLIKDLDILPPVDRKYAKIILQSNSHLRIYASRGCWGKCSFCDIIGLYGQSPGKVWRRRSATSLVDEIEQLMHEYQTDHFIFNDDQFLVKGKSAMRFVEEFSSEIKRRQLKIKFELMCRADTVQQDVLQHLKSIGLVRVFLGLESFDQKQLKRYKKGVSVRQNLKAIIILYKLKIDMIVSVILADAHTSILTLLKQFVFLYELRRRYFTNKSCRISVNNKLEIYRGSRVYSEYKSQGIITNDNYLQKIDFKLRFWTDFRLKIFYLEEKIISLIFNFKTNIKGKEVEIG